MTGGSGSPVFTVPVSGRGGVLQRPDEFLPTENYKSEFILPHFFIAGVNQRLTDCEQSEYR